LRAPGGSRDHRKAIFPHDQRLPGAATIRPALAQRSVSGISATGALLRDLNGHVQRLGHLVKSA